MKPCKTKRHQKRPERNRKLHNTTQNAARPAETAPRVRQAGGRWHVAGHHTANCTCPTQMSCEIDRYVWYHPQQKQMSADGVCATGQEPTVARYSPNAYQQLLEYRSWVSSELGGAVWRTVRLIFIGQTDPGCPFAVLDEDSLHITFGAVVEASLHMVMEDRSRCRASAGCRCTR